MILELNKINQIDIYNKTSPNFQGLSSKSSKPRTNSNNIDNFQQMNENQALERLNNIEQENIYLLEHLESRKREKEKMIVQFLLKEQVNFIYCSNFSQLQKIQKKIDLYIFQQKMNENKKSKRSRSRDKKKHKKRKYSNSSSDSQSSIKSRDSSFEHKKQIKKIRDERRKEKEDLQRKRQENKNQIRPIVKLSSLSGLLKDVKKINQNLDVDEVNRANIKFKEIDHSERQATLMSNHLTTQFQNERDEYIMEFQNGEYKKVFKPYQCTLKNCNIRFQFSTELKEHMNTHIAEQQKLNQIKANEFTLSLQKNIY